MKISNKQKVGQDDTYTDVQFILIEYKYLHEMTATSILLFGLYDLRLKGKAQRQANRGSTHEGREYAESMQDILKVRLKTINRLL